MTIHADGGPRYRYRAADGQERKFRHKSNALEEARRLARREGVITVVSERDAGGAWQPLRRFVPGAR